jgi:hypothetical protein
MFNKSQPNDSLPSIVVAEKDLQDAIKAEISSSMISKQVKFPDGGLRTWGTVFGA